MQVDARSTRLRSFSSSGAMRLVGRGLSRRMPARVSLTVRVAPGGARFSRSCRTLIEVTHLEIVLGA
ncbi:hypothetical protein DEJ32_14835 [Curtobacterium sp. MCPF17_046]|nr:hypothetical protein DEJ32_14835 [Curtobacterium sp. MCPF17_046]